MDFIYTLIYREKGNPPGCGETWGPSAVAYHTKKITDNGKENIRRKRGTD